MATDTDGCVHVGTDRYHARAKDHDRVKALPASQTPPACSPALLALPAHPVLRTHLESATAAAVVCCHRGVRALNPKVVHSCVAAVLSDVALLFVWLHGCGAVLV